MHYFLLDYHIKYPCNKLKFVIVMLLNSIKIQELQILQENAAQKPSAVNSKTRKKDWVRYIILGSDSS